MRRRRTPRGGREGLTLIEVVIVIAVLSIVLLGTIGALTETSRSTIEVSQRADLRAQGSAALRRLERDLSSADFTNPLDVVGSFNGTTFDASAALSAENAIELQPVTGWNSTTDQPTLGPAVVWYFRMDTGRTAEADNGADDDGDGLVDERELVRQSGGLAVVVLEDIMEVNVSGPMRDPGFLQDPTRRAELRVRFTTGRRLGVNAQGQVELVRCVFDKTITLRNALQ